MNDLKTFYKLDQVGDIPAEDLIRYAIDGHLTLSVNLTAGLLYEPCKPCKELDPLYRPPLLQPDELVTAGKDLLRSDTRIAKTISPADSKPLDIVIDSGNVRSVLESLFVLLPDNQLSKAEFGFKEAVFKNGEEFIRPIGSEDYIFRVPEDGYLVITKANLDAFKVKQAKPITAPEVIQSDMDKPWLVHNPLDPQPDYSWYTPARYFARKTLKEKPLLINNKKKLAGEVATLLFKIKDYPRGRVAERNPLTVLKAFTNCTLT